MNLDFQYKLRQLLDYEYTRFKWIKSGFKSPWLLLAVAICLAFGFRALLLIDASTLWLDELYTVGKSFQPFDGLLASLRDDVHPPFYNVILWFWGQLVGQNPVSLRLFSWLAYLIGGLVMVQQANSLAQNSIKASSIAAVFAFCSPFPIRYAIEGRSYSFLLLLISLAWWSRSTVRPIIYGLLVGLVGMTHFYGLPLFLAASFWDGCNRRWSLSAASFIGVIPGLCWFVYASETLFSGHGGWIPSPNFGLFEETLARCIGIWPLPKLLLVLILLGVLRRWGVAGMLHRPKFVLLDKSGLIPTVLMVIGVIIFSLIKPIAFSRYFIVILPAVVPFLAVQVSKWELNRFGLSCCLVVFGLLLASWWGPGFAEINPGSSAVRESDQFRSISQRTSGFVDRYSPRARWFNLSDRMELSMGRIPSDPSPWGGFAQLEARLSQSTPPKEIWLASSSTQANHHRRQLQLFQDQVERIGYICNDRSEGLIHARLLQCRPA